MGVEGKSKTIPVQPWAGSEGTRRLWPPDFEKMGTRIW